MNDKERVYTREEVIQAVSSILPSFHGLDTPRLAEKLAKSLDLKLAPEKPELPRRLLGYKCPTTGVDVWIKSNGLNYTKEETLDIKAEARRCYNAVRECLEQIETEQDRTPDHTWIRISTIIKILREGGQA